MRDDPATYLERFLVQTVREMASGVLKHIPHLLGLCIRSVIQLPQRRFRTSPLREPIRVSGLPVPRTTDRSIVWHAPPSSVSLTATVERWNVLAEVILPGSVCLWLRPQRKHVYGVVAEVWAELVVLLVPRFARNEQPRWQRLTAPIKQLRLLSNDAFVVL